MRVGKGAARTNSFTECVWGDHWSQKGLKKGVGSKGIVAGSMPVMPGLGGESMRAVDISSLLASCLWFPVTQPWEGTERHVTNS
jgi:hypothetical protein